MFLGRSRRVADGNAAAAGERLGMRTGYGVTGGVTRLGSRSWIFDRLNTLNCGLLLKLTKSAH